MFLRSQKSILLIFFFAPLWLIVVIILPLIVSSVFIPNPASAQTLDCCQVKCSATHPRTCLCNGTIIDVCDYCDNSKYYFYRCSQVSCPSTTCTSDGCNGNCPTGCTVSEDPDCGCANNNGCCPAGCNATNDNDCSLVCADYICNGICGSGCTSAQDPDCGSAGCCGDSVCQPAECAVCSADCQISNCCGNGSCDTIIGENSANCSLDCTAPDTISPTVNSFQAVLHSNQVNISWNVTDSGGSHLKQIEIWRAADNSGSPGVWTELTSLRQNIASLNIDSHSGSVTDTPPIGTWWYGLHAIDQASNIAYEPNPPGSIKIIISPTTCSDGTPINTCASNPPKYCNNSANLVDNCAACGCTGSWICGPSGTFCCDNQCNGTCSIAGCTASEDPDCGPNGCCGDGNCGIGENNTNCSADCACTPTKTCADYPGQCGTSLFDGCTNSLDCSTNCASSQICCSGTCQTPACNSNSDCDDGDSCTVDTCNNPGTCLASCSHSPITTCANNDGCCPTGCNSTNDNDCGGSCTENWTCTAWSACTAGKQTRTCTDSNSCGTENNKPPEEQMCLNVSIIRPSDGENYIQGDWAGFDVSVFGGTQPYTFQWTSDKQGDFSTEQQTNIDTSSWATGTHLITAAVTDSRGLIATDSISININPAGTLTANIQMWQTEFARDPSMPANFGVNVIGGTYPYTFQWSSDKEGNFSTDQWPSIDVSSWQLGTHHITVTVTDNAGNTVTDMINVKIASLVAEIFEPNDYDQIEQGYDIGFGASIQGGTSPYICNWYSDRDGLLSSACNFVKDDLSLGIHTITLTVTDSASLTITKTIYIQIIPLTPITVNITSPANNSTFQQGNQIDFQASHTGGVYPNIYSWTSNLDGQISTIKNFSKNNLSVGNHIITLTVSDSKGNSGSTSINLTVTPPAPLVPAIDSPANNIHFKSLDEVVAFSGSVTGGVTPYTYNWSSSLDGNFGNEDKILKTDLSTGSHIITFTVTDAVGASQSNSVNITIDPGCAVNDIKNTAKYSAKEIFLISDENWRDVLSLVPLTTWNDGTNIHKYPTFIFHQEGSNFDADSAVHFMQMYEPDHLTTIGSIPANLNNLLTAAQPTGAGLNTSNINNINPSDYFSYWSSYNSLVVVDYDNYKAGLMASVFASHKNSPIIFVNSANLTTYQGMINGKTVYTIGDLDTATQSYINNNATCQVNYTVEELQKWYAVETNSNKLILVNPNDLNIEVITTFTPEKSGSISHLFSKMSLAAPFLAAAKKEVIAFTELPDSGTNSGCSNNPTITANITQADRDAALAIQNLFVKIPKFLTIVASPRAIPDSKYSSCDNSAQRRVQVDLKYGSLDDDALHIGEILFNIDDSLLFLNVGRIYGITITDAFSNVMSSIYYNNLINKLYESNYNSMLSSQEVIGDCESMTDSLNVKMNNSGYNSICFTASTHPNCTRDLDPPLSDYYNKRIILHNGHGRYTDWYRTLDYSQIPWLDLSFCAVESCLTSNFWQGGKRTFALHWLRKGGIAYQGAPSIEFGYAGIAYSDICKDINSLRQLTGDDHLTITLGEGHKQMCLKKPYYRMSYILLGDPTLQPKFLEIN